jgi:hypothetical protein
MAHQGADRKNGGPMTFKARRLPKIIALFLTALWLVLFLFTLIRSIGTPDAFLVYVLAPLFALTGGFLLLTVHRSFSTLTINDEGVILCRLLGRRVVPWNQIARLKYWVELQEVFGGSAQEPFAVLVSAKGKTLLRLKSTYDFAMFDHLLTQARSRNISVDDN